MESNLETDLSLWRYGIISPLLHRTANELTLRELLEMQTASRFLKPDGSSVQLSAETLRKWLYRYNQGGLPALSNRTRADKGAHDVPESLKNAMAEMRGEHPGWTLALLLEEMIARKVWDGKKPSRSVLYRYAGLYNLGRDPQKSQDPSRPFQFERFGQLWIADFMHGPRLIVKRKKRKCYLHVIIDDCTRYVVSGRFYTAENVETLIRELMKASRRLGFCQRFYADNGAAYASSYLKIICARLGIHLTHTPPYRPQGRSKVERFFRTVRERFLAKQRFTSLDEMNQAFERFLEDYHNKIHATLKCTPMQKRMSVESVCRRLPETVDMEAMFRQERRCRVYGDCTIRLKTKVYEVPACLPNSHVTVYFMPWDLSRVHYGEERHLAVEVDLTANAHRFDNPAFAGAREDGNETE
jgi:transposase InsO family protein